jgi:hypothetical protein
LQIWGFLSCKSGDFILQLCPFLLCNKHHIAWAETDENGQLAGVFYSLDNQENPLKAHKTGDLKGSAKALPFKNSFEFT